MKINYCLPIIKNNKEEILRIVQENRNIYQYIEVWLEPIDSPDNDFLEKLITILGDRLILLFWRENIQAAKLTFERKQEIVTLIGNRCLIDLDILNDKEILEYIGDKKLKMKTIVSYHNYQETPTAEKLKEIIDTMMKYQPDIVKVSTLCKTPADAVRLLEVLLDLKSHEQRCIVLGMGEHGSITRIFGTLWGNELIYAPQNVSEQSAPGQLTKEKLETIFKNLQK